MGSCTQVHPAGKNEGFIRLQGTPGGRCDGRSLFCGEAAAVGNRGQRLESAKANEFGLTRTFAAAIQAKQRVHKRWFIGGDPPLCDRALANMRQERVHDLNTIEPSGRSDERQQKLRLAVVYPVAALVGVLAPPGH